MAASKSKSVTRARPSTLAFDFPAKLTSTGIQFDGDVDFRSWQRMGKQLREVQGRILWWLGDWLNYGDQKWGEKYREALAETDYDYQTLRDAKWVAAKVDLSRRRDKLGFAHHREVAKFAPDIQDQWLALAEDNSWTREQLRAEIKRKRFANPAGCDTCIVEDLESLIAAGITFGTIYVDPPWPYSNQATRSSTSENYSTMTLEDIAALPVEKLAASDAHLHLWTTNAFGFEARELMEAWGFKYASCLVWVKPKIGMGNYWRLSHEFLLLGTRGRAEFADHGQRSWVECKSGRHSEKPQKVRDAIEKVSPTPRLELFARHPHENWVSWGNEIDQSLFAQGIERLKKT